MSKFNDFIENLDESRTITLKRRYTENHPAVKVGKVARVRNKMLEAIADGKITQEEFNAILKEFSTDSGKWMRRNAKYFSVSEDGISLSKFGKRALSSITVNESEAVCEATVEMDALDPDNRDFLKFLKKNKVEIIDKMMDGPAGGHPVITMQGKRKDLEKVLGDCEFGWCDDELGEYIQESVVTEAKYDKKALLKAIKNSDDAIILVKGKEYIIYNPDNGNDDNAAMWGDKTIMALDQDGEEHEFKYSEIERFSESVVTEGRAFVAAAKKAKEDGKTEFEFGGKTYPVTIKEENETQDIKMENKRMFESFSDFVNNLSVNEDVFADLEAAISDMEFDAYQNLASEFGVDTEDPNMMMDFIYNELDKKGAKLLIKNINKGVYESVVNEAFSSMKLQSILTSAGSMPKDFAKTFYQMAKIQLDKIQDVDIIEMDPEQARKEKRNNAVYLYFTTNEKPNPYAGRNSWGVTTIPANTLLGVTDGSNEWLAAEYSRGFGSKNRTKALAKTKRNDGAGFGKSAANDTWGSGISSLSKVAELADRAYVLDLDILRARYSSEAKRDERTAAKKGATAFKSDKDFKKENLARYHDILANRAAAMPIDKEVLKAIDVVTAQIKDGLTAGKKGKWGDVVIGQDPKGREIKLRDASNAMQNLLDDFNRYVDYTNQAKREEEAGYGSDYYSREVKNYAKSIKDRISKIEKMDYAW